MEFFMTMPIFCERQFDKYRMTVQYQDMRVEFLEAPFGRMGITQNELSGRYRTIPDRPYLLPWDVRGILGKLGPAQIRAKYTQVSGPEESEAFWNRVLEEQHERYQHELRILKDAEVNGEITNAEYKRAREVLRGVLGTSYLTDMRIVCNLNAFEWIVNQRLAPDTQLESRAVAYHMVKAVEQAGVAQVLVSGMKAKHGWGKWMAEVEEALNDDVPVM
jgi:thymidylate synthase ThyX